MNPRRTYAVALCAIAVAVVAAVAWSSHTAAIGALLDQDAVTVRSLAQSADMSNHPERIIRSAMLPGVHVRFISSNFGPVYDAQDGNIQQHPAGGNPGGEPSPNGAPEGPPPGRPGSFPGEMPPRGAHPPSFIAADLAHIPPRYVSTPYGDIALLPAATDLTRWLVSDIVVAAGVLLALGAFLALSNRDESRRTRSESAAQKAREAEYRRFLADAGHELKTPLTIVTGYIDVLTERINGGDASDRRIVDGMRSETKRMRELVEKLLLLSRLDARASVPQYIDAATVVRTIADEARGHYSDRTIDVAFGNDANVIADPHDLEAAVRNLVENAIRYAPASPIRIEASRHVDRVLIRVIDQGPGVADDEREAIFGRFCRGRERTDAQGSGLGLAIVRGVAERWDGVVRLVSQNGETSFTLDFPLAEETEA